MIGQFILNWWGQKCLLRPLEPLVPSLPLISTTQASAHKALLCALALATWLHASPFSFFFFLDNQFLTPLVCTGFMALTPVWVLIAKQNPPIMKILKFGWFPIILAMVISRWAWIGSLPLLCFPVPSPGSVFKRVVWEPRNPWRKVRLTSLWPWLEWTAAFTNSQCWLSYLFTLYLCFSHQEP